jgi:hypothetical protein
MGERSGDIGSIGRGIGAKFGAAIGTVGLKVGDVNEGISTNAEGFCWNGFSFLVGVALNGGVVCSSLFLRFCSRSGFLGLGISARFREDSPEEEITVFNVSPSALSACAICLSISSL